LGENEVSKLSWPPYSPDLNPIEHCRFKIKEALARHYPESIDCDLTEEGVKKMMRRVLPECWELVDSSHVEALIESMPQRIQACIDADGWHIKY